MANSNPLRFFKDRALSTLVFVLNFLTEPASTLNISENRRVRLLNWLLLVASILAIATILLLVTIYPQDNPRRNRYFGFIFGLVIILFIARGFNHTGYYNISAGLTVACAVIGPWGSLLLDPSILQGDIVPLTYVVLPILLSSILLHPTITIGLAILQLIALGFISWFNPGTNSVNWPSFFIFVCFASGLSVISNFVSRYNLRLIDEQMEMLILSKDNFRELSIRDHLTNLFNRQYLDETLEREIQRAVRIQHPLGVIMLDLDDLKPINDSFGHSAGDTMLQVIGKLLSEQLRLSDIACRYGGDEFILILPGASLEVTLARAELLRDKVRHLQLQHKNQSLGSITISLGVAVFPNHGDTSDAILRSADNALYRAKHEGRDCVVVADNPEALAPNAFPWTNSQKNE